MHPGDIVFEHACKMGLEGIVSKRLGSHYRSVFGIPLFPPEWGQFAAIQAVAPSLRMEVIPISLRDAGEIERAVTAFRTPRIAV